MHMTVHHTKNYLTPKFSSALEKSSQYTQRHTHAHTQSKLARFTYLCMCVCVCVYMYMYPPVFILLPLLDKNSHVPEDNMFIYQFTILIFCAESLAPRGLRLHLSCLWCTPASNIVMHHANR